MEQTTNAKTALEKELEELSRHKPSAKFVWFDYLNEKYLLHNGIITAEQFNAYEEKINERLKSLLNEPTSPSVPGIGKASVFLSYNNKDRDIALRIQTELAKFGVTVRMDDEITLGLSIRDFIIQQIRENTAVLWLVSENSLKSSWVNYETTMAGFAELLTDKHFIPVSETKFFMENQFFKDAWAELDRLILADDLEIRNYKEEGVDPQLLENSRAKRLGIRNQLSPVLMKLREESRVLPIGPIEFSSTLEKIAQLLTGMEEQKRNRFKR